MDYTAEDWALLRRVATYMDRHTTHEVDEDDLFVLGFPGLAKAKERWNPDHPSGAPFAGFAFPVIVNEMRNGLRSEGYSTTARGIRGRMWRSLRFPGDPEALEALAPDHEDDRTHELFEHMVKGERPTNRRIAELRFLEGLSLAEIADRLDGVSQSAVDGRLFRLKHRMRKRMRDLR